MLLIVFFIVSIWWFINRKQFHLKIHTIFLISIIHTILGGISAKLLGLIEVGFSLPIKGAPLRIFGCMTAIPIFYCLIAKLTKQNNFSRMLDISCVGGFLGLIIVRSACLFQGCCLGVNLFNTSMRWPLREIEIIYYILFFVYFVIRLPHKNFEGKIYPYFMITYGILRFILEFFRETYSVKLGIFHIAHIWSILFIISGFLILHIINKSYSTKK